ncbi:hypothetical protein WA026_023262 [Henosepilachna vigintioctopunctata]|uniref:Kazal-like domain-containing protein n=1 Tax=Henosepilachna vigintioctopunctata TaxID=420089 RepID=A0AAW1V5S6_9CUCU
MKFSKFLLNILKMPVGLQEIRFLLVFCIGCLVHLGTSWPPDFVPNPHFTGLDEMEHPFLKGCTDRCLHLLDYDPQCGTDGRTYPNRNSIRCMQVCLRRMNLGLDIAYAGFCKKDRT